MQYLCGKHIEVITLVMIELTSSQTSEKLKTEIMCVLLKYGTSLRQVYATTTDNGANMLKADQLLRETLNEDVDQDINEEELLTAIANSVRCAAHTLQLAVNDVLRNYSEIFELLLNY